MKSIVLIGFIFFLIACGSSSNENTTDDDGKLNGFFARATDTLQVEKSDTPLGDEIDFTINSTTSTGIVYLFDIAIQIDDLDDSESYSFKDSSEFVYEDLTFTYDRKEGTWKIEDILATSQSDSGKYDYSGVYKPVE